MASSRPKRAPDLPFPADTSSPASKKPRFDQRNPSTLAADAPDEDEAAILELDEIGKGGQQVKRNAVRLDGYDSDSSTENFDARAEEKARAEKRADTAARSKDEEEADMFADLDEDFRDGDDDQEQAKEAKPRKGVRFLDADEIEGQVASSKSGGHVSAELQMDGGKGKGKGKSKATGPDDGNDSDSNSSSSSESDDDSAARDRVGSDDDASELGAGAKKKHAPRLDAFNMKQEGEEGRFDESGNYIRKAVDPDAQHDAWLDGVRKRDMKRARQAEQQREESRRARALADDALLTADILAALITRLERAETPLEALQRLASAAPPKPKKVPKWKQKKKGGAAGTADTAGTAGTAAETARLAAVEALTSAADQLLTRGQTDIYELERESLVRQWQRETGDAWVEPKPSSSDPSGNTSSSNADTSAQGDTAAAWEYRWADGRDGAERHGPFDRATMRAWSAAGYFGDGVEFRR
ncbi:uncharacterized protein K452DRAFT_226194, partial [Aplosporella prunicola CBS 121167]